MINPEFDYSTSGWTCTSQAVNRGIASNQGGTIHGAYFENWDSRSFTGDIYQELKVPDGTYRLTASAFRSYPISGGSQEAPTVTLFANQEECEITDATPKDYSVTVYVKDETLRIGLRSKQRNFQWMGIDNVRLTYYGQERHSSEEIDGAGAAVYLRNKKSGMFLNAGQSWGTQAVMSPHALDFRLVELPNGRYALDSRINNGGGNHYAAANGYLDGTVTEFHIDRTENGSYTLRPVGENYWGHTTAKELNTTLTHKNLPEAQWDILTKATLSAELNDATAESPADATFLIKCPDFGRNDSRITAWQGDFTQGGDVTNMCAGVSRTAFNIHQNLGSVPNGFYEVRMQGFYRDGTASVAASRRKNSTEKQLALLYANEYTLTLASVFNEANSTDLPLLLSENTSEGRIPASLEAASALFTTGHYTNRLIVEVTNGQLTIGIKSAAGNATANSWTVFDNVELYYLGNSLPTGINTVYDKNASWPNENGDLMNKNTPKYEIFDLAGRKVSTSQLQSGNLPRGIYVKKGVKFKK